MKTYLFTILLFFFSANLWGQKFAFGINAGVQFPNYKSQDILGEFDRLFYLGRENTRLHLGLNYKHQITDILFLELAPSFFQEKYQNGFVGLQENKFINGTIENQHLMLYLPVLLRIDLGYKLSLAFGGGSNFSLLEKKIVSDFIDGNYDAWALAQEEGIFQEISQNRNKWPLNAEVGIRYGFGRFSLNGKFVYRISSIYTTASLEGRNTNLPFNTNYLQVDLGYRLVKSKKN